MSLSLTDLEGHRSRLLQQFLSLGDFRPGSVSAAPRRCGKPTCHRARPDAAGHPHRGASASFEEEVNCTLFAGVNPDSPSCTQGSSVGCVHAHSTSDQGHWNIFLMPASEGSAEALLPGDSDYAMPS
jgi:hypothetical protein